MIKKEVHDKKLLSQRRRMSELRISVREEQTACCWQTDARDIRFGMMP